MKVGMNMGPLLAVSCILVATGCPSTAAYQPIPIEEARAMNSRLSAFSSNTRDLLEDSAADAETVGQVPGEIRPRDFDADLVRHALMACFNSDIDFTQLVSEAPNGVRALPGDNPTNPLTERPDLDGVSICQPGEMIQVQTYIQHTPSHITDFVISRVLTVDELRVNLKHVLQERIAQLQDMTSDGQIEVMQLRDRAREIYNTNLNSSDITEEQRLQTQADHENLQGDLDAIESLLEQVEATLPDLRSYRRQLIEDISRNLVELGN